MNLGRLIRAALLAVALCFAMLWSSDTLLAAPYLEFVDPHPAVGNLFGNAVVPLSTGNVVVTSPSDDAGGSNAGAVYLFNGATGALISTLRGSAADDNVGSGAVTALSNGNFVVRSPNWDNGGAANAGAVTWCSGTTGLSGVVSPANSLVGSTASDAIGTTVTALTNGNYVVLSFQWNNGAVVDAGAVTWGSGTSGIAGAISAANSLVGSTTNDLVGGNGVIPLSNGNYVVSSANWDNGGTANVGAATWGNGASGVSGAISAANSLVGSTAFDGVGTQVLALPSGNYVVRSTWNNGANSNAGAATWCSGSTGMTGTISAANSLVGSSANDNVGNATMIALANGNYVVASTVWDNGAISNAGAVTWGNGTSGVTGAVSSSNSLVGSTANDNVGFGGVIALTNGNYVVGSNNWDNGAISNAGAATWGSGTAGVTGVISVGNSLVGSTANDNVGNISTLTALTNGNYVVRSPNWNNGGVAFAGAATWSSGTTGSTGTISAANSLVGSTAGDAVGSGGVAALSNGNYVVASPNWDNGAINAAGAATWGSGTTGVTGAVSVANSLVGSTASDNVGVSATALTNGNYVVTSLNWDNGIFANAGAATWGNGTTGMTGVVSTANSLVGARANDAVGDLGVTALTNGNYVVSSQFWDTSNSNVGAVTWGNGTAGTTGVVSAANSLVGSATNDITGGVTALSNGNYVVRSPSWDISASAFDAGAATWGSGTTGVTGVISAANSLVGSTLTTTLQPIVEDVVHGTFIARFLTEVSGRVRVGPIDDPPVIVSLVDIPNDQGGWLRLTFNRTFLDVATLSPPATTYGVWRKVPGTLAASAVDANARATSSTRSEAPSIEELRAAIVGLEVREVEGQFYITGPGSPKAEIASSFPSGTWALVMTVPALQRAQYVVEIPTISNAAANDFVVTAHTTTPSIWFVSAPASGQSVDNLAPAPPTGLTGAYSGGQTNLDWNPNTENDLDSYRVYRGYSAGFTPGVGNLIASPTSPSHDDVGPAGAHYKVSAVDVNGNESGFTLITPGQTTGVGGGEPVAFALDGIHPNPASGTGLHVAFALPTGSAARLELLDVTGRRVLAREVGTLGEGRHRVNLAEGRRVAPGLYWVRLTQGANRGGTRVAVIE